MSKPYRVQWGIHRGTMISRDIGEAQEFETESDALGWIEKTRARYKQMGYHIWYAYLLGPGEEKRLIEQTQYR